jgi:hypothetical protein
LERTLENIETNKIWIKNARVNQLISNLSQFFWSVLDVVSRIQISFDAELSQDDLIKPRKAAYFVSVLLMVLFVLMAPDKIPSILSSAQFDTAKVLETTQEFVKAIRKILPVF